MWTLDELGQFPSLGHAVCEVDVLLAIVLGMEVGHVGVEHQSAQVQHQQPHGLPAEPVSMVDLGRERTRRCCGPAPAQAPQPEAGPPG